MFLFWITLHEALVMWKIYFNNELMLNLIKKNKILLIQTY
jgi:hypothetical protein